MPDNRSFTATVTWTDGFNVTKTATARTAALAKPSISFSDKTTRSIKVAASASNGSKLTVKQGASGSFHTSPYEFDKLSDGKSFDFYARKTDGFNNADSSAESGSTTSLPTLSCSRTVNDSVAPGKITVSAGSGSGGGTRQVALSSGGTKCGSVASFSNLSAGTYYPYAYVTDGYNTNSDACAGASINSPSTNWGDRGSCPLSPVAPPQGTYWSYQIRQSSATGCLLRVYVTLQGYQQGVGQMDEQIGLYTYTIGSGATTWAKSSGSFTGVFAVYWP